MRRRPQGTTLTLFQKATLAAMLAAPGLGSGQYYAASRSTLPSTSILVSGRPRIAGDATRRGRRAFLDCSPVVAIGYADLRRVRPCLSEHLDQRAITAVGKALRSDAHIGLIELDTEAFDQPVHIVEERHRRDQSSVAFFGNGGRQAIRVPFPA